MIQDNYYADLPADDELALATLEKRYRDEMNLLLKSCKNWSSVLNCRADFMNKVLSAADALEVGYFRGFSPMWKGGEKLKDDLDKFDAAIASFHEFLKVKAGRRKTRFNVRLDSGASLTNIAVEPIRSAG